MIEKRMISFSSWNICFCRKTFCILLISILLWGCSQRELFVDTPDNHTDDRQINEAVTLQGNIQGDLLLANSPYKVIGNIVVDSLKILNIQAGVKIYFEESSSLVVRGKIFCAGSLGRPVVFTSINQRWKGIVIKNSSGASVIQYAVIENIDASSSHDIARNGAVEILNSECTINNSIFRSNKSSNGGALYFEGAKSTVSNNLFISNSALTFGGAVVSLNSSNQIFNNTFFDNEAFNYGGGLALINSVMDNIQNNIFFKNRDRTGNQPIFIKDYKKTDPTHYIIKYNFFSAELSDPAFVSEGNFHLKKGSPCIDSGNPSPEYNDADGTRNNQGAYGGPLGNW